MVKRERKESKGDDRKMSEEGERNEGDKKYWERGSRGGAEGRKRKRERNANRR